MTCDMQNFDLNLEFIFCNSKKILVLSHNVILDGLIGVFSDYKVFVG